MKKFFALTAVVVCLGLFTIGCEPSGGSAPPAKPAADAAAPSATDDAKPADAEPAAPAADAPKPE
jgi:hypothetical protein